MEAAMIYKTTQVTLHQAF